MIAGVFEIRRSVAVIVVAWSLDRRWGDRRSPVALGEAQSGGSGSARIDWCIW
jgi:hypothetical protein